MERYDFIICGAGLSGMLLAYFLVSEFPDCSILILEKNKAKYPYQRMWSFWTKENHPFENIIEKEWRKFSVFSDSFSKRFILSEYRIQLLKSEKLFEYIDKKLRNFKVVRRSEAVEKTGSENGSGLVYTETGGVYAANWVFDSTGSPRSQNKKTLYMQGWNWEITTSLSGFDPGHLVFQDLRTAGRELAFYYLLPVTAEKAYVNLAVIKPELSKFLMQEQNCRENVKKYLSRYWGLNDIQIRSSVYEFIPINRIQCSRKLSPRVMAIGVKGGLLKSTTSYGMFFILRDSMRIVRALKVKNTPFHEIGRKFYYRFLDNLMFDLLMSEPEKVMKLYDQMFQKTEIMQGDSIMGFLNEENNFTENINLLKTKNPLIFLN